MSRTSTPEHEAVEQSLAAILEPLRQKRAQLEAKLGERQEEADKLRDRALMMVKEVRDELVRVDRVLRAAGDQQAVARRLGEAGSTNGTPRKSNAKRVNPRDYVSQARVDQVMAKTRELAAEYGDEGVTAPELIQALDSLSGRDRVNEASVNFSIRVLREEGDIRMIGKKGQARAYLPVGSNGGE